METHSTGRKAIKGLNDDHDIALSIIIEFRASNNMKFFLGIGFEIYITNIGSFNLEATEFD